MREANSLTGSQSVRPFVLAFPGIGISDPESTSMRIPWQKGESPSRSYEWILARVDQYLRCVSGTPRRRPVMDITDWENAEK
jgi:hypothetical protein